MDEEQKQTIIDLPKVIAVGIASPVATLLTSRFGVASTLIGLALSAVIITVLVDVLKVYLARVPGAVITLPGGFQKRSSLRNLLDRIRLPFSKFSSLKPARRRSILIGSIAAAGISFFVGLSVVTALEVGVGKSLSCWVWNECALESSTEGGEATEPSTLPSILGGGQSVSSGALKVQAPSSQQPVPEAPGSSSQPEGVSGSEQLPSSPQPGQRWRSPSGASEGGDQRPSSSEVSEKDERPSSFGEADEGERWSSSGTPEEDDLRSGPSSAPEEDEQRSPTDGSKRVQQQEDQSNQPSSGSERLYENPHRGQTEALRVDEKGQRNPISTAQRA